MGMFDYVEYEANCERCGTRLGGFQSKSGPCSLSKLQPEDVDWFYAICHKCGSWHDFKVERTCTVSSVTVSSGPCQPTHAQDLSDF